MVVVEENAQTSHNDSFVVGVYDNGRENTQTSLYDSFMVMVWAVDGGAGASDRERTNESLLLICGVMWVAMADIML